MDMILTTIQGSLILGIREQPVNA